MLFSQRHLYRVESSSERFFALLREQIGGESAFQGRVTGDGFEVRGITAYRSVFTPSMKGKILARGGGLDVGVTMRPHREVFIFLFVWLLFLSLFSLVVFLTRSGKGPAHLLYLLIPAGLAVFTLILTGKVFESDCRWAREAMEKAFFHPLPGEAGEDRHPST